MELRVITGAAMVLALIGGVLLGITLRLTTVLEVPHEVPAPCARFVEAANDLLVFTGRLARVSVQAADAVRKENPDRLARVLGRMDMLGEDLAELTPRYGEMQTACLGWRG